MSDQFPTLRTLEDHVRAATRAEPAEREIHLRAAENLAVDCFSMRALLRELINSGLGDDAVLRRVANQVLTMATAERDISGIRDAADFARFQLSDDTAAAAILDDAVDLFATPGEQYGLAKYGLDEPEPAPGYVFVLLAQDLAKLPEGRDGVLRALTVGRDVHLNGADPDDLVDIAEGWIELIDESAGRALLAQAQAKAAAAEPISEPDPVEFPPPHRPTASMLLDLIRSNITTASLELIAKADYGMDYRNHLAALTAIVDTGLISAPSPWVPREVMELYRWHTGEQTDHLARALCCTVLSLDASLQQPGTFMLTTGPYLVESAVVLGEDYVTAARELLAWRYCVVPEDDSDAVIDRQSSVLATLLLEVLSGTEIDNWSPVPAPLTELNAELAGERIGKPTSEAMWRHLLGLAVPRIPNRRPEYSVVTSALAAVGHR